jgi:surfactin synthase thioesterase subunit
VVPGGHFYLVPARRLVLDVVMRAVTEGLSLMQPESGRERAG